MADECVLIEEWMPPTSFTVADGTGIEKGAVLKFADPATASTSDGDTDVVAGIAAAEKIASNGQTKLSVHRSGKWKGTAGVAGVTAGMAIITDSSTSSANRLVVADVNSEHIVGFALETATSGETFLFILNPMAVQLA